MRAVVLGLMVACGTGETGDSGLAPCDGGGSQSLEIGQMQGDAFAAWVDGDSASLVDFGGAPSLRVDAVVGGLDTSDQVNAVLRVAWSGSDTDDYLGGFFLECDAETGVSPLTVFAAIPESMRADPTQLDGATVPVTLTVTDLEGRSVNTSVSVQVLAR